MVRLRPAHATDATAVAELHADSWRRHYRGALADAYLDGDVASHLLAVWTDRLGGPSDGRLTLLAEDQEEGKLVGFAHTVLDEDPAWGALLDNLHVAHTHQRRGIGARLLRHSATTVAERAPGSGFHLWVLEQNGRAQAFYRALGGRCVERAKVPPPGGDPARLNGSPSCLRYAWPTPPTLDGGA